VGRNIVEGKLDRERDEERLIVRCWTKEGKACDDAASDVVRTV
jgi:hypothetical protein